ncbi:hypothetical protein PF010_g1257 [Phytophthora fragariae]|nr:hypothetical protein PF003_g19895 [Phytophthora fragariae]KAE8948845.1 hypothetical protein PF009_g1634 [Phytophthora fragariae]KAE9137678.1 hypothetical protein PF010_g1257 [Phytophthora fragariae]KAE9154681.1 hypothetical protein PF006_g1335 [Phytophthora fragariae]KAE9361086.1 hypothetical protein PF008_g1378 [Phytophthora fragariae]
MTTVMTSFQHLRTFRTRKGREIRVRSPVKIGTATDAERVLDSLAEHKQLFVTRKFLRAASKRLGSSTVSRGSASAKASGASKKFVKEVAPAQAPPGPPEPHRVLVKDLDTPQGAQEENLELIEGTLQLLFHCEYHALVEYVECAVPILFGVYLTILYQLPVHEYYPHTRDLEAGQLEGMLMSLSVYVTLEVLSFVGMHMALKRKFHLSALYQLAFVLETHVVQLQSRMFVWIVFILQFTLAHYGVDFTFQFAWLH